MCECVSSKKKKRKKGQHEKYALVLFKRWWTLEPLSKGTIPTNYTVISEKNASGHGIARSVWAELTGTLTYSKSLSQRPVAKPDRSFALVIIGWRFLSAFPGRDQSWNRRTTPSSRRHPDSIVALAHDIMARTLL